MVVEAGNMWNKFGAPENPYFVQGNHGLVERCALGKVICGCLVRENMYGD